MDATKRPQNCRWAEPALYLPFPYWMDAWDKPWTCVRDPAPRALELTTECANCPRWEERAPAHIAWTFSQVGL